MEMYKPALDLYKQVLKINPNYKEVYYDIAHCFDKLGKCREAKRFYHKFLESFPQDEKNESIMKRVEQLKKHTTNKTCVKLSLVHQG